MTIEPILAVDLDGTIATYNGWKGLHEIGRPLPKVREGLSLLKKAGFKILIFTTRTNTELQKEQPRYLRDIVERYLEDHNIPYDEIYVGPGKPCFQFLIDDRAVRFVNWDQAVRDVLALRNAELNEWRDKT